MKSIKEHRQCWQPYWSNHVFGIVGHSTLLRKPPLWRALRLMKQIQSRRTQPVQFVWSLSFNIWVPHNSRGKKKKSNTITTWLRCTGEHERERETGKKRLYSRIQLMLKAPQLHNKYRLILKESPHRNIAFLPVLISCGTCTWRHCNDQRKEGKKLKYNRRATFVPFFTAELGRWRSEDTLLRNCKKPWFLF